MKKYSWLWALVIVLTGTVIAQAETNQPGGSDQVGTSIAAQQQAEANRQNQNSRITTLNGSVAETLWQLVDQIQGSSGPARENLEQQWVSQVATYTQLRDTLRRAHRVEVESLSQLPADQLLALDTARQQSLADLKTEQTTLRTETNLQPADRLKVAGEYAAIIKQRLDALNVRLLTLTTMVQSRVDQIQTEVTREQLSSDLAQLTVSLQQLDGQVSQSDDALNSISSSADPIHDAAKIRSLVKNTVGLAQEIMYGLQNITSRIPS